MNALIRLAPALASLFLVSNAFAQGSPSGARPAGSATPQIRDLIRVPETNPVVEAVQAVPAPVPAVSTTGGGIGLLSDPARWVVTEPGARRNLALPAYNGEPGTVLGNEAAFRALSAPRKAWFIRKYHLSRGNPGGAEELLTVLFDLKLDLGLENFTDIAAALTRESRMLVKEGKADQAVLTGRAAVQLAPDLPSARTALARAQIAAGDWGGALGSLRAAASTSTRNLRARTRIAGNSMLALLGGALLAYAGFLLVAYLRYGRFLIHDFRHAFPDNMPPWMSSFILVPFLAFPLVFGLGILPLLAWLTLAIWIKLDLRERVVAALFLLLGAASPMLVRNAAAYFAFETADAGRLYAAVRERDLSPVELRELTAQAENTDDPEILYTVGNIHLRSGRYGKALGFYERSAEAGGGAEASVGLGNIRYAVGDVPGAMALYKKALAESPDSFAARFNLFRLHNERTELDEARQHLAAAKANRRAEVESRIANTPTLAEKMEGELVAAPYLNRLLAAENVSESRFLERANGSTAAGIIARQTWRGFSPALPLGAISVIFLAALALAGGLAALMKGGHPARPCPKCAKRLCLRCDGPPYEEDLCVQCYHAFLNTEGIDPRARAAKELEVRRVAEGRRRKRTLVSILVPGGGHLFGGDTARGAVLLLIASICVARLAGGRGWFRAGFPTGGTEWIAPLVLAGAILLVSWILGLRGHDEPQPGPAPSRGR